jgi:hypothetical protein
MKKYTQQELLEEGFWKGIGSAVKGVARGADYIVGQVAPKAQSLYKDPYNAAKGLVRAVQGKPPINTRQGTTSNNQSNISPQEMANIKRGLTSRGITLLNIPNLSYTDQNTRVKYYNVEIESNGRRIRAIVDANGNFPTP